MILLSNLVGANENEALLDDEGKWRKYIFFDTVMNALFI